MDTRIKDIFTESLDASLEQIIISKPSRQEGIFKIKLRPIMLKQHLVFQVTEYVGQKVLHKNLGASEVLELLPEWFEGAFQQAEIKHALFSANILISKKGTVTVKKKKLAAVDAQNAVSNVKEHNRKKNYIIEEGCKAPFLLDLGIVTPEGKVVSSKYDKFRQINKFLEFIERVLPALKEVYEKEKREIRIIDFGCGKSYLTFAMYYYLKEMNGYPVRITGLDLKADVIKHCNEMKNAYGYDGLEFLQGDIAGYEGEAQADMVVTLHACDTATDYALYKAVAWNAKVILSVPCCQHEVNAQIHSKEFEVLLKHGLIKERISALLTDAIRAQALEDSGYKVDVLEFIDMEHTPKNILIRAVKRDKNKKPEQEGSEKCRDMMKLFNIDPSICRLLKL